MHPFLSEVPQFWVLQDLSQKPIYLEKIKSPPDKKSHAWPRYTTRIMKKRWRIIYSFSDDLGVKEPRHIKKSSQNVLPLS